MENSPKIPEDNSEEQDYQRRGTALEANQLHGKDLPPERIGHVLIAGESKPRAAEETSKTPAAESQAATMSRRELLEISDEITVDNTTLRHIYETHLIGENGLRRLVYEHMRGGNLKEALHHEILEHETGFERDPRLRHQPAFKHIATAARSGNGPPPSLDDLLSKAGLVKLDPGKELTAPKLLSDHLAKRTSLPARQRRLLDFAFVGTILILLILVILLAMSRG